MTLRDKTFSGLSWTATGKFAGLFLHFPISILLARLLTPEAFGLIGMIIIFTGFVQIFSDAGFGAALIQQETIDENHRSSIFWTNVVVGLLLTGIVAASAPLVASFYGEDILVPLTLFISLQFTIGSLGTVHQSLLRRELAFKSLTIVSIITQIISASIAIILALEGYGVWALAWHSLFATTIKVAILWWVSPWRPKFLFNLNAVKDLFGFSSNLMGFNFVNYWTRQADDLLIGKLVGSEGLGIYTKAYGTMLLPLRKVTSVFAQVMFPALSQIQDDVDRVKRIYLKCNRLIAFVTMPMMVGLAVVAEQFVIFLYGTQWSGMIPIVQILCLVGLKQPIESTTGWIYQSQGSTDKMFQWNIVVSVVTVLAFIIGIQWGVIGVAWAYAIRSYVLWYYSIEIPGRLIGMSFWDFNYNVSGIFLISLLMGACVLGVQLLLSENWPAGVQLIVEVLIGVIIYLLLSITFKIKSYLELKELIKEKIYGYKGVK